MDDPPDPFADAVMPDAETMDAELRRQMMRFSPDAVDLSSAGEVGFMDTTSADQTRNRQTSPERSRDNDDEEISGFVPQVRWSILSVDPDCTDASRLPRNAFEREVVKEFAGSQAPTSQRIEYREDIWSKVYHYYEPIRASQSCSLVCHCSQPDLPGVPGGDPVGGASAPGGLPWKEGDVMGIVHVELPTRDVREQIRFWWSVLLSAAILTMFFAIVAFYGTIRYLIVRPLRHLREVTDAISAGNLNRRADLHSGDVFETLGMALNRMLRHLVSVQEELRLQSHELDVRVAQLARANIHLHEMNRARGDFLATMSHELRTPLNSIIGFSDVLRQVSTLTDRQRRYVENIGRSGRSLLEMINDVLDLAKLESGRMEAEPREFHIAEIVEAQCDIATPLAERKKIDLSCVVEPGLPVMFQDRSRVQQILNNLLSNAIRFTPDGGRVRILVRRLTGGSIPACGMMELQVIDTGVGISEEDRKTIFQKFRQGRTVLPGGDVLTREASGTGLGLSIVRELCQLLGGEVSVDSELGTGSIFTVRIPWRYQRRIDELRGEVVGFTDSATEKYTERDHITGENPVPEKKYTVSGEMTAKDRISSEEATVAEERIPEKPLPGKDTVLEG
ncbi:MAG: ATP-binding protein, partial [Planctomycetia bacterium]|nr:ATP-binding protein [Planctomycetia bacterium]